MYEYELIEMFERNPCNIFIQDENGINESLCEVKIDSKIADMVLFDKSFKNIIAIEFKVKNWKDALKQAVNYQIWANESYVAISKKVVHTALKNKRIFMNMGIGLLSVDGVSKIEIEAKKSLYINKYYREEVIRVIKEQLKKEMI